MLAFSKKTFNFSKNFKFELSSFFKEFRGIEEVLNNSIVSREKKNKDFFLDKK
jgi:hypothetical protein